MAPSTIRAARHFSAAALSKAIDTDAAAVIENAELVTGELVANAVRAGAQSIEILLDIHYDRVELAVTDNGTGWPVLRPPDLHATSGRGLQIVEALATSWGVTRGEDQRTIVWAQLACNPLHTTTLTCTRTPPPPPAES